MAKSCSPTELSICFKKKLNQFKQSVCYLKAMATSKIYSKRPALAENYRYFF
jgi:hypothetical protein